MLNEEEDERMARVLRLAGPRPDAAPDRHDRVRHAVHREWQAMTRRRASRRRALVAGAVLSAAAALLVTVRLGPSPSITDTDTSRSAVGVVERTSALTSGKVAGDGLRAGDWVETNPVGRLAVRLAERTSIRLDTGTRLQLVTAAILRLERGAVYVDTGVDSSRLEVRTPLGVVTDVGTQFEVRLDDAMLLVRVRTGLVELHRRDQTLPVGAGSQLTIAEGAPVLTRISPAAREWDWAASLAPPFAIEGRTLAAFLDHLAREQGWTFTYADPALARDASRIVLHGSVGGLSPADALAVAARTSGLAVRFNESADSTLVIVSQAVERK